jgi:hypothetical protein
MSNLRICQVAVLRYLPAIARLANTPEATIDAYHAAMHPFTGSFPGVLSDLDIAGKHTDAAPIPHRSINDQRAAIERRSDKATCMAF